MARRKDYLNNMRAKKPSGCAWCGADVPAPVTNMTVCSDVCVQMLFEGIDDELPVMPMANTDPASVARKWTQYNESYGGRVGMPSDDGDATGGGPYTPGSAIEEFGGE